MGLTDNGMFHFQMKEKNIEVRQQCGKYDSRRRRSVLTSGRRESSSTTSDLEGRYRGEHCKTPTSHSIYLHNFQTLPTVFWYLAMCIKNFNVWNMKCVPQGQSWVPDSTVVMNLIASVAIFERRMGRCWILFKIWRHFLSRSEFPHFRQQSQMAG